MRRIAAVAGLLLAGWLVVLLVAGWALRGRVAAAVTGRLEGALGVPTTVAEVDLGLVRGRLRLGGLSARRDGLGALALEVDEVVVDAAPAGGFLFDRHPRRLAVRGLRLDASSAALLGLRPRRLASLHAGEVIVDDARVRLSPSALLPGLGQLALRVDHARAGPTELRTPLSWLLGVSELRASIDLPGGATLRVELAGGQLAVAGGLLGATPVTLPLRLPAVAPGATAADELRALVALGRDVGARLVARRAGRWLDEALAP